METYKKVEFDGKVLFARGRNGMLKQTGIEAVALPTAILLTPLCTRGSTNSCAMQIPRTGKAIDELIDFLKQQKI